MDATNEVKDVRDFLKSLINRVTVSVEVHNGADDHSLVLLTSQGAFLVTVSKAQ
jgi:hypothetical protein